MMVSPNHVCNLQSTLLFGPVSWFCRHSALSFISKSKRAVAICSSLMLISKKAGLAKR